VICYSHAEQTHLEPHHPLTLHTLLVTLSLKPAPVIASSEPLKLLLRSLFPGPTSTIDSASLACNLDLHWRFDCKLPTDLPIFEQLQSKELKMDDHFIVSRFSRAMRLRAEKQPPPPFGSDELIEQSNAGQMLLEFSQETPDLRK
jgi:hypothetical protein